MLKKSDYKYKIPEEVTYEIIQIHTNGMIIPKMGFTTDILNIHQIKTYKP